MLASGVLMSLIALLGATNFEPYLELTSSSVCLTSGRQWLAVAPVGGHEREGAGEAVGRNLPLFGEAP